MPRTVDSTRTAYLHIPATGPADRTGSLWMRMGGAYSWLIARLSRVTTSGRTVPEIEGLRFLAIASVVVLHISGYLATHSSIAWSIPVEQDWLAQIARNG